VRGDEGCMEGGDEGADPGGREGRIWGRGGNGL
jgi:hypothetical protein